MCNIEKITNHIAAKIARHLKLDQDHEQVLAYGAFNILQISYSILLVILFGAICDVLIEALIISFTIAILRKYSGGVHAASPNQCAVIGTLVAVGFGWVIKELTPYLNSMLINIFCGSVFLFGFFIMYRYAPVDTPNKPIKKEDKRKRLKRNSIRTLWIFVMGIGIAWVFHIEILGVNEKSIISAIVVGIFWQSLTLTRLGYLLIDFVDLCLRKSMLLRGGER